jgi:hypothetical protein
MRVFILFAAFMMSVVCSKAQQVTGNVKDTEGKPLAGSTIKLLKDSLLVKLAISNDKGAFSFSNVSSGNYMVNISHVGYPATNSTPFSVNGADMSIPEIVIAKSSVELKGVQVVAQKPIVEVKADKTVLNVEGTINSTGSDALDLLRKSPGVTVDKDDNLGMNGKNGVQVYIDGRPSPLSGSDLANYLKSMQSSNIESIELISNPSAKYDAAGNAGIINIRLKKNKSFGTNGSVNAGWNIGTYAKYNAGISLNHRNKNINIFGNYGYNDAKNAVTLGLYRTVLDSLFDQNGSITANTRAHNFKVGADYFINKKNTLGVIINGTYNTNQVDNYSRTGISYLPTGKLDRYLVADNSNAMKNDNINFNLNYNYVGSKGKNLTINADHGTYKINNNQFQPNTYFDSTGKNMLHSITYRMITPATININSVKVDYEQNLKKGKLGYGAKTAFVKTDNNFQRYNVYTSASELDKDRSNRFRYTENINAAYVNYSRPFKRFQVQLGLRVENTNMEGTSTGLKNNGSAYTPYDSTFKRHYTDFFPSAAISFTKNAKNQFSINYSRRIDRPNYQDLNPFEFKLDEYTFQKGNINLLPQYTNSFGFSHTYKYKLTTSLNYSIVKDMFTQLFDTAEASKAFISKRNLATQNIASMNISYPYRYKSYSVFTNLNTSYSKYTADFGEGRKVKLDAFALNLYMQHSLKFAKTWTAEMTAFYNAPTVYQGSLKAKSLWSIDAGIQKQVFNGRGSIKTSVSDILHTLKFNGTSDFAGQKTTIKSNWESRQFKLNFSYRFGSNQVKSARMRSTGAEEEMKRTQQSSSTPGI